MWSPGWNNRLHVLVESMFSILTCVLHHHAIARDPPLELLSSSFLYNWFSANKLHDLFVTATTTTTSTDRHELTAYLSFQPVPSCSATKRDRVTSFLHYFTTITWFTSVSQRLHHFYNSNSCFQISHFLKVL